MKLPLGQPPPPRLLTGPTASSLPLQDYLRLPASCPAGCVLSSSLPFPPPCAPGKDKGEYVEADPRSLLRHPVCVVSSPSDGRLFVLDLEVEAGPGRVMVYKCVT